MGKTVIAVPAMNQVDTSFFVSTMNLKKPADTGLLVAQNTLVYEARNQLAVQACNADYDYVLWIDSDMNFSDDCLERLFKDDKDITTGLCFRRRPPYSPCIWETVDYHTDGTEHVTKEYLDYPKDSLFRIEACGAAFMLVKTDVLKACFKEFNNCFQPIDGFSEDISFCLRARALGYEIWCDSRVKIAHVAQAYVNESTYQAYRKVEEDVRTNTSST